MGKYIGIDLGTTISVAAYIDASGNHKIIEDMQNNSEYLIPSAVYLENGDIIVGKNARRKSVVHPENYKAFAKRDIGSTTVRYKLNGYDLRPQDVSACVLQHIISYVEKNLNDKVLGAVITVPAYFTDEERTATNQAAELIGLNVLGNLEEPTAAALAYGIMDNDKSPKNILVYDLGGGTFDITLLHYEDNRYEVKAKGDNSEFGGMDFDVTIIDWFKEEIAKDGIDVENIDINDYQELILIAEEVKKELSSRNSVDLSIKLGNRITKTLTREEFNKRISVKIDQSVYEMTRVVESAGMDKSDIDKILLVGGSSRIPLIAETIKIEFGQEPVMEINPDEAVAIGAAYYAAKLARDQGLENLKDRDITEETRQEIAELPALSQDFELINSTSHGIGIVVQDPSTKQGYNYVMIPKNTPLPADFSQNFVTISDSQNILKIQITEGEFKDLKYTHLVGVSELRFSPKPKGYPMKVNISCDTDGLIHVAVFDIQENKNLGEMNIKRAIDRSDTEIKQVKELLDVSGAKLDIG